MPEGHVIHRLARQLTTGFGGLRVQASSPQGRFAAGAELLDGSLLVAAEAFGKHLFCDFDIGEPTSVLAVHLGLIGKFRIGPGDHFASRAQVRLQLDVPGVRAQLVAPQTCALLTPDGQAQVVAKLGADPLRPDANPDAAWQRISRSGRTIAELLMDQRITPGVGNIYRAEVLFRAQVDPQCPGNRLRKTTWERLWTDLKQLMADGLETGRIDTVAPQHSPAAMSRPPRVDPHGGEVYVYRRAGQPCLVCGAEVKQAQAQGRNLFWCQTCQRGR